MDCISFGELRMSMNALGHAGVPFVWGVDYESSKCFILDAPFNEDDI